MIDISKIEVNTLELMKEVSKSRKEYVIPLIHANDIISAYDVIECTNIDNSNMLSKMPSSESFVCAIDPSLVPNIIAQFHNHPGEIKVLVSTQDMIILDKFNIPLIIGGKKEIKLFELKYQNTFKDDLENLKQTQDNVFENLSLGKPIDDDLRNKYRDTYEKALSNLNITFIYLEK